MPLTDQRDDLCVANETCPICPHNGDCVEAVEPKSRRLTPIFEQYGRSPLIDHAKALAEAKAVAIWGRSSVTRNDELIPPIRPNYDSIAKAQAIELVETIGILPKPVKPQSTNSMKAGYVPPAGEKK